VFRSVVARAPSGTTPERYARSHDRRCPEFEFRLVLESDQWARSPELIGRFQIEPEPCFVNSQTKKVPPLTRTQGDSSIASLVTCRNERTARLARLVSLPRSRFNGQQAKIDPAVALMTKAFEPAASGIALRASQTPV